MKFSLKYTSVIGGLWFFSFSLEHGLKPQRSSDGLTPEEDTGVRFHWMHMWPQRRWLKFALSQFPPPGFIFQFPPYTKISDFRHLPHPIFNKKNIMPYSCHDYVTNNPFGK